MAFVNEIDRLIGIISVINQLLPLRVIQSEYRNEEFVVLSQSLSTVHCSEVQAEYLCFGFNRTNSGYRPESGGDPTH